MPQERNSRISSALAVSKNTFVNVGYTLFGALRI